MTSSCCSAKDNRPVLGVIGSVLALAQASELKHGEYSLPSRRECARFSISWSRERCLAPIHHSGGPDIGADRGAVAGRTASWRGRSRDHRKEGIAAAGTTVQPRRHARAGARRIQQAQKACVRKGGAARADLPIPDAGQAVVLASISRRENRPRQTSRSRVAAVFIKRGGRDEAANRSHHHLWAMVGAKARWGGRSCAAR